MRTGLVGVVVAVVALTGCGVGGGTADAAVTLTVPASYSDQTGPGCASADGYSDITAGTVLTLATEDGEVVDRAELDGGELEIDDRNGRLCVFGATFADVPDDSDAEYVITGSGRDGEVLASGAELLAGDVQVTIGG